LTDSLSKWEEYKRSLGNSRPWHLLDKNNRVDDKTFQKRLAVCVICPFFAKNISACKKCGCLMKGKARLKDAECPLNKWNKITE
jgi:hypothetical protein